MKFNSRLTRIANRLKNTNVSSQLEETTTPFGYKVKTGAIVNTGVNNFNTTTINKDNTI